MYTEDDLLPISALQHLIFCERQCALIYIEQVWEENLLTAEGRIMHEHVHDSHREVRGTVRIEYGMPLRSLELGLVGIADVVEFHGTENGVESSAIRWVPCPVEYKHGKSKKDNSDRVQLCAQSLCLEEMLDIKVVEGALFYGRNRRREAVCFDASLRKETKEAATRLHALIESGITPKPVYSKRCDRCSLVNICLPKTLEKRKNIRRYLAGTVQE